jgi:hypothetical protein
MKGNIMKLYSPPVLLLLTLLSTLNPLLAASPLGTSFTYAGRLSDGTSPASGIYDLRFAIYDALADGSLVSGPVTNSAAGVTNGLFTVALDFGPGVFDGSARWLEIAVRTNGSGMFTTLRPRQAVTPTPYAIYTPNAGTAATAGSAATVTGSVAASQITGTIAATNIAAGTITGSMIASGAIGSAQLGAGAVQSANIASGAVGASQLASNSITAGQLASGAAAANLSASGQAGVASGGLVLSATENTALINAGYVRIGTTTTSDNWQQRGSGTPLGRRSEHKAVWTGSEMIVWGGHYYDGSIRYWNDGARYNPAANSWTTLSTVGAPAARTAHTAVWTGSEMIVWGGETGSPSTSYFCDGGRYSPAANIWSTLSTNGAPAARDEHTRYGRAVK